MSNQISSFLHTYIKGQILIWLRSYECKINVQESTKCVLGHYFSDCLKRNSFAEMSLINTGDSILLCSLLKISTEVRMMPGKLQFSRHHSYFSFYFHMPLAVNKS